MSNKLMVILVIISLIFMCFMGGGLYLMWNKIASLDQTINPPPEDVEGEAEEEEPVDEMGEIFALDTFIVNLSDNGGKRFLRVTMDLELKGEDIPQEIEKRLSQVRDAIFTILPTKKFEDIHSVQGKIALRNEIMTSINGILQKGEVVNVFFTEFVIQ